MKLGLVLVNFKETCVDEVHGILNNLVVFISGFDDWQEH
jgi:hypothetical protein